MSKRTPNLIHLVPLQEWMCDYCKKRISSPGQGQLLRQLDEDGLSQSFIIHVPGFGSNTTCGPLLGRTHVVSLAELIEHRPKIAGLPRLIETIEGMEFLTSVDKQWLEVYKR